MINFVQGGGYDSLRTSNWWKPGMTISVQPTNLSESVEFDTKPVVVTFGSSGFGDSIWPIFQMLHTYNFDHEDFQILTVGENGGTNQFYDLIRGGNPVLVTGARKCFDRIFIGSNGLSYSESRQHPRTLTKFRDFVLERNGMAPAELRHQPNILIVNHSATLNMDEILGTIKSSFPKLTVKTVDWTNATLLGQIKEVQQSDIMFVTFDVNLALFLPKESTLIVPCKKFDIVEQSNEVRIWFKVFPRLRTFEVCGDRDESFEEHNVRINVTTLADYMELAVEDWHHRRAMLFREQGDHASMHKAIREHETHPHRVQEVHMKSSIVCSGASHECGTDMDNQFTCTASFATRPFAPTVCLVRNACLVNRDVILYDNSPFSGAFDSLPLTVFSEVS